MAITQYINFNNGILPESDINTGITVFDGIKSRYLSGTKNYIALNEELTIPQYYEYNLFELNIDGIVNNNGTINFL